MRIFEIRPLLPTRPFFALGTYIFVLPLLMPLFWFNQVQAGEKVRDMVIVRTDGVAIRFSVEIADTRATRSLGLMYRPRLHPSSAMLFDFKSSRLITMWMKGTLIPLDMLFIDEQGDIVDIATWAKPESLTLLTTATPARYVLEVNAGLTRLFGIRKGDIVRPLP